MSIQCANALKSQQSFTSDAQSTQTVERGLEYDFAVRLWWPPGHLEPCGGGTDTSCPSAPKTATLKITLKEFLPEMGPCSVPELF